VLTKRIIVSSNFLMKKTQQQEQLNLSIVSHRLLQLQENIHAVRKLKKTLKVKLTNESKKRKKNFKKMSN
jgi:hypothetical protein